MSAKVRIALVGAGVMGGHHARVIAQSERSTLAVVVDPAETTGGALAAKYGTKWQPEPGVFHDIDAVVVASPTEYHTDLVMLALDTGLPVLVEKPVTTSFSQTELLVALAEKRQIPIMCGFVERFNPAVLTAIPMIEAPLHVTAQRHSPYANRIRVGVAWDLLIHDVDACLRLIADEPASVRSGLGQFHPSSADGGEDVAEAVMTFNSGAVASLSASRIGQRKIRQISVAELDRTIEIDLLRRDITVYRHVSAELPERGGYRQQTIIEIAELVTTKEPLAAQLDHFLNLISGRSDFAVEHASILPAHRAVALMMGRVDEA